MAAVTGKSHPTPPTPLLAPDLALPAFVEHLLRIHATLRAHDLWHSLQLLLRDGLPSKSFTLEIGRGNEGDGNKVYRHAYPRMPRDWRRLHPAEAWFAQHPGAAVCRLADVVSRDALQGTLFYQRVMRREGWDKFLSIASWHGSELQGVIHLYRTNDDLDFTTREVRLAEALQPHFQVALDRVLAHEEEIFQAEQFSAMLEEVPVGLLLLDWDSRLLWRNGEATHGCAVWNYGERRAAALKTRRAFRVPAPIVSACADLRRQWEEADRRERASALKPHAVSEHALGLHAQVTLRAAGSSAQLRPTFQIQLDYRRPRGDRNRPLSPGAVALLARLSAREREVAMRMREGLRTAEIAAELGRSPLTIKTQLAAIFTKLGIKGRARVIALLNR
jgi:DNA-binding CsgD family transcriptional regulator